MARPKQQFKDLPTEWQKWLKRIERADTKWRRLDSDREDLIATLKRKTGRADYTVRSMPEYKEAWEACEAARIERAELFLAATEDGVSAYRIAKHLGYPAQRAVASAIQSLKGERVDYRKR